MKPPSNGPRPKSNETKKPEASSELQYTEMTETNNTSKYIMSKTSKNRLQNEQNQHRNHNGEVAFGIDTSHNLTNFLARVFL
jgi:hypothetical protein